jgi:Holliday junction resolvase RusA-like endonuclease
LKVKMPEFLNEPPFIKNNWLNFFVPGLPCAKGYKVDFGGQQHLKSNVKRWEKTIALAAQAAAGAAFVPYEGFVSLEMTFMFPIPPSRKKLKEGEYHGQDPDVSNLVKSAEDAIKRLLFIDDNRAMLGSCTKHWCAPGNEGVEITVRFL